MEAKEYSLIGEIIEISELVQVSDRFKKRELVVKTDGRYPQYIMFVFVQIKSSLPEDFKVGQTVEVFFNVKGRKRNGRYWNELQGWRIVLVPKQQPPLPEPIDQYTKE